MRLTYHNLVIELPMDGILAVESIRLVQGLNAHGWAGIKALSEEDAALVSVEQAAAGAGISISSEDGRALFCGRGDKVRAVREGGLYYLYLEFYGYTREWDLTEKSQSFLKGNDTYAQVLEKVLSEYPAKAVRDEATGGAKIPGMLLQYEETDWEFLKRLASHFSTFLVPDDTDAYGKVYFGIPHMDRGTVLTNEEYAVLRGKERYDRMAEAQDVLSQEMTGWRVRTKKSLYLGEQVMLGHIGTVVTAADIHTEKGGLVREYELSRRKGILTAKKKNDRIYGMSIPATVKERQGNQVRVQFDIDASYEASDDMKFFTYAIETSNFYCMPVEGSRVHIYFPSHDEQDAMAVHALSDGSVPGGPAGGQAAGSARPAAAAPGQDVPSYGPGPAAASFYPYSSGADGGCQDHNSAGPSAGSSYDSGPSAGGSGGGASSGGSSSGGGSMAPAAPKAATAAAAAMPEETEIPEEEEKEQAPKDPPVKRFSDPSGSFLELAPYGITLSPGSQAALVMDASGTLSLDCRRMTLSSGLGIYLGGGSSGDIPEIQAFARTGIKAALSGGESSIMMNKDTNIRARFIKKDAELKKTALPRASVVEKELTAGDAELRDSVNDNATAMLAALAEKKKSGWKKVLKGGGSMLLAGGAVALTWLTGGLTAPLAVVSVAKATEGFADLTEGIGDVCKANKGDMSQSFNFLRDTVFGGNEGAYQTAKGITDLVFSIVSAKGVSTAFSKLGETNKLAMSLGKVGTLCKESKAANLAVNIGGDMLSTGIHDYIETGKVDPANLAISTATGTLKGFGMNNVQLGKGVFKSDTARKAVNTFIGTGVGMTVDYGESRIREEEYHPVQSLVQNFIQAGLGQLFGEPIDAASGAFLMTVHEFILPDILTPVYLTRRYLSTDTKAGWLGKGWHFNYEGRLCRDGDTVHVQLPDGYCAAYTRMEDGDGGVSYQDAAGSGRYCLSHDSVGDFWNVMDIHLFRNYCYNGEGLLVSVVDKNGCSLDLEYDGEFPARMTTPLGYGIRFAFKDGRLASLEDDMGRCVQYRYEDGLLVEVVHMDGGITRYAYTEDGFLERPTDQTGLSYLTNTYDAKGRVALQTLANGDTYRADYDDRKRETSMEYSRYPGKTVYTYDEKMAVTKVLHPDGTEEAFGYDARNNRILAVSRTGAVTRWEYDERGHVVKEIRPEGLETEYRYDGAGNLAAVSDNGGRRKELSYDICHNLTLRREKVSEGEWAQERFTWDAMGRLTGEEDGEGHLTRYCYEGMSAYPFRTVYADGGELLCGYDRLGRRLWEEDAAGRREYAYNRNGWQTMERDGEGNETHRLYDGAGRMTALYSPAQWQAGNGKRTEYRYDFLDRLEETIHSDGSHEKQFLDGEGNIIKKVHPNAYDQKTGDGDGTCYEYDGDGNLLRVFHPDGGVERSFYDGDGRLVKHVLPEQYDPAADDGEGRTYTYDAAGRLLAVAGPDGAMEEACAYDLWGNCVRKTDADGYHTHYSYDLAGRLVRELVPVGRGRDDLHYRMTEYAYDGNGNRVRETRHGGRYREDGTPEEAGTDLTLFFAYDARGRLVRVEDGLGARACYRYDVRGNRTGEEQVVDSGEAGGRVVLRKVRCRYDKAGRLSEKREILDSGLPEGAGKMPAAAVTSYTYDANGNRTGIVTPEGYRISREYDCRDRLSMERMQDRGNGIDLRTFFAYDGAGNVASVRQQDAGGKTREVRCSHDLKDRLTRVEELDGPVVQAAYDRNDRMSGRRDILPSDGERFRETLFCYDVRGNLVESRRGGKTEEARSHDRKRRLTARRDGDGVEVRCRYGIQEGPLEITTASSREQGKTAQAFAYDARGNVTGARDGCGNGTGYTYDAWGRITAVRTAEGGLEEYAYGQAGNVVQTKDANGGRIRYAYNSMGLVCAVTDQCGNTETFRYDKEGRETEHTDRNGTVTETKYNLYGQPVLQSCTDKDGERQVMGTWEYDSFGQPTKAVAGGSCYTYEYRPDGKLLKKWSSGKLVESCTYYRDGSLRSLTDASGKTVRYGYDDAGRLRYLGEDSGDGSGAGGSILAEYRYTTAGRIREVITKGGIKTAYAYDGDGNISRLTIGDGTQDGLLYDAFLLYDLNGNRIQKSGERLQADGKRGKMSVTFRYDSMNRLAGEDREGTGERYAYDLCGNRLSKEQYREGAVDAAEQYRYNERNELTERTAAGRRTAYRYDLNGSLVSEEEGGRKSEYRYDLLDRQTYVRTLDGREQENLYDGEGLRAGLEENGKRSVFLFHDGEILSECDGEGIPVRRHIHGAGLSHVQSLKDSAYHAYHQDEQGSTVYITGAGNVAENCYRYDAFGNLTEKREGIHNRILYTGQQYDQETGQYYLRARYYNPVVGRFLQEDTYRGDGLNLYAYCANNPVGYFDPSGHKGEDGCPSGAAAKQGETEAAKKTGETQATAVGKKVHKQRADARRASGEFDSVNQKLKDADGNVITVPKTVGKTTGRLSKTRQAVMPDAVKGPDKGGIIIDDKPMGRPISKDYQEMRRNVEAYEKKYGVKPNKIIIERYDPKTGEDAGTEAYSLFQLFNM